MKDQSFLRRISIILFVVMLVLFIVHVQILVHFNRQVVTVHGNDNSGSSYMEINDRENSTSSWLKRGFQLTEDKTVDLTGQTVDETLYNNSGDVIQNWGLQINITGDCFINQAWNGEVEIHQFTGSEDETVQRLNLQDYKLEDIQLQYQFDGDLLIPLKTGDYIVYFPSEYYTEMPVRSGDSVKIGMIFYYLDKLDLSNYDLTVRYHRIFSNGWSFIAFIIAAVLCVLACVAYVTSTVIYRNARKQMEQRRSGLSNMSELYEAIYIINLPADEITPVSPGEYIEKLREQYSSARELLNIAVRGDSDANYLADTLAFVDTETLPERMRERESIVWEFVSRHHGWCRISTTRKLRPSFLRNALKKRKPPQRQTTPSSPWRTKTCRRPSGKSWKSTGISSGKAMRKKPVNTRNPSGARRTECSRLSAALPTGRKRSP